MKITEIIMRIPKSLLVKIKEDLIKPHEFAYERIGFIGSNHKVLKSGTILIFMKEYYPVMDENYVYDKSVGARIDSDAIRNGMQNILDHNVGLFHVHYHEFSDHIPEFSVTDMTDNPEIVQAFSNTNSNLIHGMIVLGKNGCNAVVKLKGEKSLRKVNKIVEVGYPMKISFPNKKQKDYININRYDRQSFLGKYSQFSMENIKVGIVGLGGGGSHIVQQLAHLGVQNFVLYDFDIVDDSNLNRMVGAGVKDVEEKKEKGNIAEKIIKSLHPDADIIYINDNWIHNPDFIHECDIVFGCIDSYMGRRDLESECRRYLLPLIDIGMDVYNNYNNEAPSMAGQIILSLPGNHCMHCFGFLTPENLAKEAGKYGDVGGRPQVVWSNGVLASQAIGLFVDLVTGWTKRKELIPYYSFDGNTGILNPHPRLKYIKGDCNHYKLENIGIPKFKKIVVS